MSKKVWIVTVVAVLATTLPAGAAGPNGVDDLRGRWDVDWVLQDQEQAPLTLFINDILQVSSEPEVKYLASGCMRSWEMDAIMPLSMLASYDPEEGIYNWTVYSTVVPSENEPFVVRLAGSIEMYGDGVTDDVAGGEVTTGFGTGSWTGEHHDRRRTRCPSIQNPDQFFHGELYSHRDAAFTPPRDITLFDTETVIVSSAMQVEDPYGNTTIVDFYTDIFSPHVDFTARFRYTEAIESPPIVGLPYTFTLLDALGNPIEGAVATDTWNQCNQGAPVNFSTLEVPGDHVVLSWDTVSPVPGEFDPGEYQITVYPFYGGEGEYGAGGITSTEGRTEHRIPWNWFEPGLEGYPDGWDFGSALGDLGDGLYEVQIWSWNSADYANGGWGSDCAVHDSSESLLLEKQGDAITFMETGSISGVVTTEEGSPLGGIWVDACPYAEETFCRRGVTDSLGGYRVTSLPAGQYRVRASGESWVAEFYNDTIHYDEALAVMVNSGADSGGIDLALIPGGNISGTVFDVDGNPLPGIAVDTEFGGYGICTDESGAYVLEGLPLGDHNIVAGRQFCGEHPYGEQMIEGIATGSEGIDFYLEIAPEPSPQFLNLQPDHQWAHSGGWVPGSWITISFDGYSDSLGADSEGMVWFSLEGSGIVPGMDVHITDGIDFKDLHVVEASFDGVDEGANVAWGTGPAGMWIGVGIQSGEDHFWMDNIQIDGDGNWFADFGGHGQDFEVVTDAWVHVFDDDGDSTLAHLYIAPPLARTLHVVPFHPEIHGHEWPLEALVTVSVYDGEPGSGSLLYEHTKLVSDDPWCGEPCFDVSLVAELPNGILSGYVVTMTDGETTRVAHVTEMQVTGVDIGAGTVSGTAMGGTEVLVSVHDEGAGDVHRLAVADSVTGIWTVDFSVPGIEEWEQETWDLVEASHGRAIQLETGERDDGTLAYWWYPYP